MEICVSFDPREKVIWICEDPVSMIDIYSAWKEWAREHPQFEPALRPLNRGPNEPAAFVLIKGWQVDIPLGKKVRILGTLLSDTGKSVIRGGNSSMLGDNSVMMIA